MAFKQAIRRQKKARIAITAPTGGGKTWTALELAHVLAGPAGRIGVIDTEHDSAGLYAGETSTDGATRFAFDADAEFDSKNPAVTFSPTAYAAKLREAEREGFDVIVVDSLSHEWNGPGGILEMVDQERRKAGGARGLNEWQEPKKHHRRLIEVMLASPAHVIVTMRSKMEYSQERDGNGKTTIRKLGLAPQQSDDMAYEFDVVLDLDQDHYGTITKTRCSALAGYCERNPGRQLGETIHDWLSSGVETAPVAAVEQPADVPHLAELRAMTIGPDMGKDAQGGLKYQYVARGYATAGEVKAALGVESLVGMTVGDVLDKLPAKRPD